MSGHTPGPWKISGRNAGGAIEINAEDYFVCDVIGGLVNRQKANAHLIAAAPELLEAAQAAWICIGELPPTQARVEAALLLKTAIARATGVQS